MRGNIWSREELILAFNLYLKLPFGKINYNTPEIIELATLLGRSPNSIAIRLANFASCDPYHQNRGVKGMIGGLKQCQPIWDEFSNNRENLIFESEKLLAQRQNKTIESKFNDYILDINDLKGETKIREIKTRVNQNVFRQIVLSNYETKCAITNIDIPELLVASHIIPWSINENERLNPENGICLSPLYDKAFDKGLIGINTNYEIVLSNNLKQNTTKEYFFNFFQPIEKKKLNLPNKYLPKKEYLEWHLDNVFNTSNTYLK